MLFCERWEASRRRPPEYVVRLLFYRVRMDKLQTLNRKREKGAHRNVSIIEDEEGRML